MQFIIKEQQADSSHSGVICNNLVITIIAKLSRIINEMNKIHTPDNKELSIVRIMDYINTHYADEIDIKTRTTLSLYSKTCFMKYFKMYSGETPLKYLYSVRANKAKEKIEHGIHDVAFIANECGFFDSSHLNKHFKLNFGITPKQYINEKRLLHAKNLILLGKRPTDIYEQCGFLTYTSFFRSYKKYFDKSPSQT